jgi:hypothetical protein
MPNDMFLALLSLKFSTGRSINDLILRAVLAAYFSKKA